eukprot:2762871-Alexandrium_andersonii.AAC.1
MHALESVSCICRSSVFFAATWDRLTFPRYVLKPDHAFRRACSHDAMFRGASAPFATVLVPGPSS